MKTLTSTAATMALACIVASVHAEIYKWTDEKGKAHYSDQPHEKSEPVKLSKPAIEFDGEQANSRVNSANRTREPERQRRKAKISAERKQYANEYDNYQRRCAQARSDYATARQGALLADRWWQKNQRDHNIAQALKHQRAMDAYCNKKRNTRFKR